MKLTNTVPHFSSPIHTWLWILLLCFSNSIFSQQAQLEFFPAGEFLSSPNSWKIRQDKEGFLWILGLGLDRYDGYNFVNIKNLVEECNDFRLPVDRYLTSDNQLITKSDTHFFLRQLSTGKVDSINYHDLLSAGDTVTHFFCNESVNGDLYFFFHEPSTNKTTFLSLENGKLEKRFSKTDIFPQIFSGIFKITSDAKGNFFYLNKDRSHFIKIDKKGNQLQEIPLPISFHGLTKFKMGANNTFFVLNHNELFYLKEGATAFEPHPTNKLSSSISEIFDFIELPNDNLWISGNERHLIFYNHSTGLALDYRDKLLQLIPHTTNLLDMVCDQTGVIWINTLLGVVKVVPLPSLFDTYFTDAECNGLCSFRGITENEEGQIFASYYNSIFQIDPSSKTVKKPFPNFQAAPMGLGYDNGNLLLNDGRHLNISSGKVDEKVQIPHSHSDAGTLVQDDAGNWWNFNQRHLWFLNNNNNLPKWEKKSHIPNSEFTVFMHFGKTSKLIWLGDRNKLFSFNSLNNKLSNHTTLSPEESIVSLFEDENEILWLGTTQGLISLNLNDNTTKKYTTKNGLPHNFVCNILSEGDSCLWLATNSGLSRFQIEQKTFTSFYTEHGLSHNEFNRVSAYKAKDGQMFFGGMRGVNAFYPQEVMQKHQQSKNLERVMLSSVTRTDENLDSVLTNILNLNHSALDFFHWNKSITFEFCLTDFKNPAKNQFSYLLDGYNKVWSNASKNNYASYSALPPGNYTFRVKAFDGKGNWNPNELAIPIIVHPPWWQTTWAYLIYALVLCSIFYGIFRALKYRLELQTQFQFEQKEAQRLKDLDTFKSRLFTNLTHEFRTPLTVILGMAKQVSKGTNQLKIDNNVKTNLLNQTGLIEKNGKGLLRLVNQLLDLSKLENDAFQINLQNDDVLPFLNYSVSSFQSFANQQNLALKFSTNLESLKMDFDASLLQQVITNLISNAIKFTPSGGTISTNVKRIQDDANDLLQIKVIDSGIGIPKEKLTNIFDRFYQIDGSTTRFGEGTGIGLAHTKELIKVMKGKIFVKSEEGFGTEFTVQLPVRNEVVNDELGTINDELFQNNTNTLISEIPISNKNKTTKVGSSFIIPSSSKGLSPIISIGKDIAIVENQRLKNIDSFDFSRCFGDVNIYQNKLLNPNL